MKTCFFLLQIPFKGYQTHIRVDFKRALLTPNPAQILIRDSENEHCGYLTRFTYSQPTQNLLY